MEEYAKSGSLVESKLTSHAIEFAKKAHAGQTRKFGGGAYVKHTYRTMQRLRKMGVTDDTILAAAVLHDTIEDTNVTYAKLKEKFGKEVADLVDWVTKKEDVGKSKYLKNLMKNAPYGAILIKVADRIDNLNDQGSDEWLQKYKLSTDIIRSGLKKRGFDDIYDEFMKHYIKIYGDPAKKEDKKEAEPQPKKEDKPKEKPSEEDMREKMRVKMGLEHRGSGRYYDKDDHLYRWENNKFKKVITVGPYKTTK